MALNAFQQTIARNSGDDGYAELSECPLDPGGTLLAAAFADITVPDLASAITSPSESDIFDLPDDYGPMLACDRFSEDGPDSVGLFALAAPSDMNAYGELFGNPDEVEGVEILVDPTTAFGAGTFHHVCAFDELEPEFDFCEIDWVTDGVLIGVFVAGSNASAVDRAALEAGFAAQLVAIIEAFAA